jgi:electron transfer flavoprotein beta subunit
MPRYCLKGTKNRYWDLKKTLTMKIIVLMKQVASKDAILRINKDQTWIEENDLSFEVSESDGYALEEALRIREKLGGDVVICSMGPGRVKSVIKDALARGADRALHVNGENLGHLSPYSAASALAEAIREDKPDQVLTGLHTDDFGYGHTAVILAELLGLPHATIVIELDASGDKLRVKRELESGWYQWYSMPMPALLTIQSGISQIRYATLKGIMAAKKKEIKEVSPSAEIVERPNHQSIKKIYLPQKTKQTQLLGDGDAKAGAVALAEKLHTEARVI